MGVLGRSMLVVRGLERVLAREKSVKSDVKEEERGHESAGTREAGSLPDDDNGDDAD